MIHGNCEQSETGVAKEKYASLDKRWCSYLMRNVGRIRKQRILGVSEAVCNSAVDKWSNAPGGVEII